MKLKKGFELRSICGEKVVTASGIENINFNKMLSFNSSAAFLWERFYGSEFCVGDMADALVSEYGIDRERALADSELLAGRIWPERPEISAYKISLFRDSLPGGRERSRYRQRLATHRMHEVYMPGMQ